MLDLFIYLALAVISLYWFWQKHISKPANFPPGPARLPLLGSLPLLPTTVTKGKKRMQLYMVEKYGKVSGLYLGMRPFVIVSDLALIRELYKKYEASGRPVNKPFHENRFGTSDGNQRGILASSGPEWLEQRRFTMKLLKDMGFGKSSMEDMIHDEVDKLVKLLESDVGEPTSLNLKLNLSIVNALWVLLVGEHLELEDPKLKSIVAKFDQVLRLEAGFNPLDAIMQAISPELTKKFNNTFHLVSGVFTSVKDMVKVSLNEHKASIDLENPRDFMDAYLTEVANCKDSNSSFHGIRGEESLISTMLDLFLAGAETTSSSLLWAFLFLLHHPEVQTRVQAEIDEVVGSNRRVTLDDKAQLPYTNAVLMESMRMATIVPSALPHTASEDIEIGGYTIPKGANMFANILHVHFDEKYWNEPEKFNPNRFYDEATNLFKNDDHLIPFSVGKRFCLGQSLAEKEYFLFFTGLLQKFTLSAPNGGKDLPAIGKNSGIVIGLLRGAPLYKTIMTKRQ